MKVFLYKAQVKILIHNPQLNLQETLGMNACECIIPDSHPWFLDNLSQIDSRAMRKWCRDVKTWFIHFPAAQRVV